MEGEGPEADRTGCLFTVVVAVVFTIVFLQLEVWSYATLQVVSYLPLRGWSTALGGSVGGLYTGVSRSRS